MVESIVLISLAYMGVSGLLKSIYDYLSICRFSGMSSEMGRCFGNGKRGVLGGCFGRLVHPVLNLSRYQTANPVSP